MVNWIENTKCDDAGFCGAVSSECDPVLDVGELCNEKLTVYEGKFLMLITLTFCAPMLTVFTSSFMVLIGDMLFDSKAARDRYAKELITPAKWFVRLFRSALLLFLMVHGSYGYVLMNPMSYAPIFSASLSAVIILCLVRQFDQVYKQATVVDTKAELYVTPIPPFFQTLF